MTKEEKEQLEPALAPLRSLISRKDFMELAMVYLQQYQGYVIYGIDKDSIRAGLCISCYDICNPKEKGLVVITAEEDGMEVKKQLPPRLDYDWLRCFTYADDIDELLLWIQRDGDELQEKYEKPIGKIRKELSFLSERKYGWWEETSFQHKIPPYEREEVG